MKKEISDIEIARVAHEVNRAFCESLGDMSQAKWEGAPDWQRESAINGVRYLRENPSASVDALHVNWVAEKHKNGWVYGEIKNPDAKTHPCLVPFEDLPHEQRAKDFLFRGVVHAMAPELQTS